MIDEIICGDAITVLQSMPSESVNCCITSPPYYGLRDYDIDGQIGLEQSPEEYIAKLVEIFKEVKRVLKNDGTLWLNIGDSYAGSWGNAGNRPELDKKPSYQREKNTDYFARGGWDQRREVPPNAHVRGCKKKDLIGIPWMVAFTLRADGWYLRSDIIWQKPNCMPESVTDRPTKSHEYLFLLSKSQRYYYDAEAIKEPFQTSPKENYPQRARVTGRGNQAYPGMNRDKSGGYPPSGNGRNKRTVWTIATKPYKDAHFATFPEKLIEPCILAGTSEKGYCPECGKPWVRQVEHNRIWTEKDHGITNKDAHLSPQSAARSGVARMGNFETKTTGWGPSCEHVLDPCEDLSTTKSPVPGIVLDPFSGAGTVALVAKKLGRHYIGIDLKPEYCKLAESRIAKAEASL